MTLIDCKKHIMRIRWILFWVIFLQIFAEYLTATVLTFIPFAVHEYITIGIREFIAFAPPLLIYARVLDKPTLIPVKEEYRLRGISAANAIIIAITAIGGQFIMMLLNVPVNILMEKVFHREIAESVPVVQNVWEFLSGIILMALLPALLEEFWMRGIVFGAFANYSTRTALIFTTIIFAALHAKFSQVLGILFLGFMTGYVLIKTKSLAAPIIYHIFSNIAALVAGYYIGEISTAKAIIILFGTFIFIFILGFIIFSVMNRKNKITKGKHDFAIALGSLFSVPVLLAMAMVIANGYMYNFM